MRRSDGQLVILADGLQRMTWGFVGILLLLYLFGTLGCGVSLDNENDVDMSDSLRARVEAECGDDALVLAAEQADIDAICCVSYAGIIPQVHCLTGNGQAVRNPTTSKLRKVAQQ